jgi:hypothetical protein
MADKPTDMDAKLKHLGERVRLGWARQHRMTEAERNLVRQAVSEQWQREETVRQTRLEARAAEEARQAQIQESLQRGQQKEPDQREKDRGRIDKDDGHSH